MPRNSSAMTPVMGLVPAIHRRAALRTELLAFGLHAGGDFRHVRNELRAQPHRVGRTSLTGVDGLSTGAWQASQHKRAKQQDRATCQSHTSHFSFPRAETGSPARNYRPSVPASMLI